MKKPAKLSLAYPRGRAALERGACGDAARLLRRALAAADDPHQVYHDLARALFGLGEIDAALESFRVAAQSPDPALRYKALVNIACIVPGSPRANNASILADRRAWAEVESATEVPTRRQTRKPRPPGNKLRVGYCSKFFHAQNWMKPVWGVINHHDRSLFEVHLFCDDKAPTAASGYRPNRLDRVHDVRKLSNAEFAALVRRSRIDILVDLNGYSYSQRLGVFMRRPAPINIGWFNYYATSGIDAFDYIIGDEVVIPRAEERLYSERVVRVPGTYLAFSVLYPVPDVAPPPCVENGYITFGSFCSNYKLTNEVVAGWAAILREAGDARLLIKNAALGDRSNRAAMHQRFARWNIAAERILLEGPAEHDAFLQAYSKIDIALDAFPYNGGTTTTEALWQGVPVLNFNGDRWAARQSRSLLLAAGLDDWCMKDLKAYTARAITLARSPGTARKLARLRATMRERLSHSGACDSTGLCRALEGISAGGT